MPPTVIHPDKTSEIHISEADAVRDFAQVLAYVRDGLMVVIDSEGGSPPVALIFPADFTVVTPLPNPPRRTLAEAIALLPENSPAVMDADFAKDVEAAIASHRESLNSAWE